MKPKILVIDDEKLKRITLKTQLEDDDYIVEIGENALVGLEILRNENFDVVITDLRMPSIDGLTFLKEIKKLSPETEVIMMTAFGTIDNAVQAMKEGAYDYLTKPFSYEELSIKLKRLLAHRIDRLRIEELESNMQSRYRYQNIIGRSQVMQMLFDKADAVADSDTTILIEGETGTGKELMAHALHYNSRRKLGPFIKLSCAILHRDILESELFGHVKGAFTGALTHKRGRFELADTGSIFLDDVDDIPIDLQVKLLRVIQERSFERVGGEHSLEVNVRVICATKKDLKQMVAEGKFREDLYYRVDVVKIKLPPLRDRRDDIPILIKHFLEKFSKEKQKRVSSFDAETLHILETHAWSGNVRELENVVEHAVTMCGTHVIAVRDLPDYLRGSREQRASTPFDPDRLKTVHLYEVLADTEAQLINWALRKASGNQVRAAEILGIPRTTLRDKLTRLQSQGDS
jgi:DNA-binding NtrC family response regulator